MCARSFSFAKGQQAFESIKQSIYRQDPAQKEHLLTWNSETAI